MPKKAAPASSLNAAPAIARATPIGLHERKRQAVRDAIWEAAMNLFAQKSFDETTAEEIAETAGISRRSLFRYFPSKADMMAYGTMHYSRAIAAVIASFPSGYPLRDVFRETILRVAENSVADHRIRRMMEMAARETSVRATQLLQMTQVEDCVADAFAHRSGKPSSRSLTPTVLAGLTLSILSVVFRAWFKQGRKDISGVADQVLATLGNLV